MPTLTEIRGLKNLFEAEYQRVCSVKDGLLDIKKTGKYTANVNQERVEKSLNDLYSVLLIIEHKHRGKGYGREGLRLLMDAAKANGVEKLCDDIAADNPSIALFKEMGFSEEWRNDDAVMMAKTL